MLGLFLLFVGGLILGAGIGREGSKSTKYRLELYELRHSAIKEMHEIHTRSSNVDTIPYMTGLYNGLELATSTLEGRIAAYKKCEEQEESEW